MIKEEVQFPRGLNLSRPKSIIGQIVSMKAVLDSVLSDFEAPTIGPGGPACPGGPFKPCSPYKRWRRVHLGGLVLKNNTEFVADCVLLTAGPGIPGSPSVPGLPGCPWGPTGPVFPTAPSVPRVPWTKWTFFLIYMLKTAYNSIKMSLIHKSSPLLLFCPVFLPSLLPHHDPDRLKQHISNKHTRDDKEFYQNLQMKVPSGLVILKDLAPPMPPVVPTDITDKL